MELTTKIQAIKSEILSNSYLLETHFLTGAGLKSAEIENLEKSIGKKIHPALKNICQHVNGILFQWTYQHPDNAHITLRGQASIRDLSSMYILEAEYKIGNLWEYDSIWSGRTSPKIIRQIENMAILENLPCGNFTLCSDEGEILLFLYPDRLVPLRVNIEEYFDLLLESRGMYFWQQHVAMEEVRERIDDLFQKELSAIFSRADLKKYPKSTVSNPDQSYIRFISQSKKLNYTDLFKKKIDLLKNNTSTKIVAFEPNPGVSQAVLRKAENSIERTIPESILEFYTNMNGFTLKWEIKNKDGEPLSGSIFMWTLEEMMGGQDGLYRKDWDGSAHDDILQSAREILRDDEFIDRLKIIEQIEGISAWIAVELNHTNEEPRLFLIDKYNLYPLKTNFREYMYSMLQTLGFPYWQFYLTDENHFKDFKPLPAFIEPFRSIFPDADLNNFRITE